MNHAVIMQNSRRTFYPEIEPYDIGYLSVSSLHTLYYEQSGNPDGQPVIYLHGGPGMGSKPGFRRYFNPEKYRIIQFDQRGSGRSTPNACLEGNTTQNLVADIEKLRVHLGINSWHVFGGSWGSTLTLAYTIDHPERVTAIALRGVFLCREKEIQWMYQNGASFVHPDQWEHYIAPIPKKRRGDMVAAYYDLLTSSDTTAQQRAARAWTEWELAMMNMVPVPPPSSPRQADAETSSEEEEAFLLASARIECHYFINKIFLWDDEYLLRGVENIRHIPAVIAQGRHDMVCPVTSAWDLHRAWPEAEMNIIPDACHGYDEPGIVDVLVRAADRFA